jgi:hypothetical protein
MMNVSSITRLIKKLAQPNQDRFKDHFFSKRAAFFASIKNKIGHNMAEATALRISLNVAPLVPRAPRSSAHKSHVPW